MDGVLSQPELQDNGNHFPNGTLTALHISFPLSSLSLAFSPSFPIHHPLLSSLPSFPSPSLSLTPSPSLLFSSLPLPLTPSSFQLSPSFSFSSLLPPSYSPPPILLLHPPPLPPTFSLLPPACNSFLLLLSSHCPHPSLHSSLQFYHRLLPLFIFTMPARSSYHSQLSFLIGGRHRGERHEGQTQVPLHESLPEVALCSQETVSMETDSADPEHLSCDLTGECRFVCAWCVCAGGGEYVQYRSQVS